MQKSTTFNEIVNLDLKSVLHVLWIINSFSIFVQGKVILNKKVKTFVRAVMDTWILFFGIHAVTFLFQIMEVSL